MAGCALAHLYATEAEVGLSCSFFPRGAALGFIWYV